MYTRQDFLRILGGGALATALPLNLLFAQKSEKRPNVLFIMSDDHTSQAVSAYDGILKDVCPTPNIDRIANEGVLFKNCFVTNSICTPSRAAIYTGMYSHINGVYKFTGLDQSQPTLPKMMREAGYQTAFVGKYHLHTNPVGLDYWSILPGQGRYHKPQFVEMGDESPDGWVMQGKRTDYEGHSSDVIADKVLDYLQNKRSEDKPFMFFCHFKAPHDTWEFAERYRSFLEDVEIPEPSTLFDDYEGRSDMLKKQLQYIGSAWGNHTNFEEETAHLEGVEKKKMQYQLYMKKYLRCVKGVDDNVGRILDYLDESGLAENTIVMYTGDQGFFLGEHGLYDKRIMYEEALRIPLLVRWPGEIKPGGRIDGMALNVDFAPTILEATGAKKSPDMQGRSFLPLLMGTTPEDWRKSMYYRYYYSHFETEPHFGVRTDTHKLIHFDRIDQWELYDLVNDPREINNLYNDPSYTSLVKKLKRELKRLQDELGDDPNDVGDNPRVRKHLESLDIDGLKVIAGALLRSFGIETPHVVHKGKDKKFDLIVPSKPVGPESRRILVKIKDSTKAATARDINKFLKLVGSDGDWAIYISSSGFTPEARAANSEAESSATLWDIPQIAHVWEEAYPRMSGKDQAIIPFTTTMVRTRK